MEVVSSLSAQGRQPKFGGYGLWITTVVLSFVDEIKRVLQDANSHVLRSEMERNFKSSVF